MTPKVTGCLLRVMMKSPKESMNGVWAEGSGKQDCGSKTSMGYARRGNGQCEGPSCGCKVWEARARRIEKPS